MMKHRKSLIPIVGLILSAVLQGQPPRSLAHVGPGALNLETPLHMFGCRADGITDDTDCLNAAKAYVHRNGLGKLTLPAGAYYVPNGLRLDVDGLIVEGAGASATPDQQGTEIRCKPTADCVVIAGASEELSGVSVRDLRITHGATAGTGSCLTVDGASRTASKLRFERLQLIYCGGNGLSLLGGVGSGGFVFNVTLKDVDIDRVGGTGFYAHGRVSQVHGNKLWINEASAPFVIDGGSSNEAGNMDFEMLTASASDRSHYCIQLRDASSISVRNPHLESCPLGLVLFQSAQNITFDGGGYYQQAGDAYGFTFDKGASSGCDCNILLDPQGATNTSIHKFIYNMGTTTIGDVRLGWASRHQLTAADVEGVVPEYSDGFLRGFAMPLFAGDKLRFFDATGGSRAQGALFDAVWRDPFNNTIHVGSDTGANSNGLAFHGYAHFGKRVAIGGPGHSDRDVLLEVNGLLSAAAIATPLSTVPYSSTPVFDMSKSNVQKITLSGHVVRSLLSKARVGQIITFLICQDSNGGWNFNWPDEVAGGGAVTLTASNCTARQFIYDGSKAHAIESVSSRH